MARINLLPWREQLREERKRHFLMAMAGVVVGAIAIIFLADRFIGNAIDIQTARNAHLQSEIVLLDQRIKSISELKARRKQLLERMKTIQDLQGNRPIIGRIFDQMARTLPDGVYFTDVKMTDKNIAIAGAAEPTIACPTCCATSMPRPGWKPRPSTRSRPTPVPTSTAPTVSS